MSRHPSMRVTHTEDGTVLMFDPDVGTVSAATESAAWHEIQRRKAEKKARQA